MLVFNGQPQAYSNNEEDACGQLLNNEINSLKGWGAALREED